MQNKTRIGLYIGLLVVIVTFVAGTLVWMNHTSPTQQAQDSKPTAQSLPFGEKDAMNRPDVDVHGQEVTLQDIDRLRQRLLDAGLPADKWAPSDIKKIIIKASKQGIDPVAYARENFHGDLEE